MLIAAKTGMDSRNAPHSGTSRLTLFSWTSVKSYETWAVQYGTPGSFRRYHVYGDFLFMPSDDHIVKTGAPSNKFGLRLGFEARSILFSFRIEGGLKPGVKGNTYLSVGLGSKFSLLFRPMAMKTKRYRMAIEKPTKQASRPQNPVNNNRDHYNEKDEVGEDETL